MAFGRLRSFKLGRLLPPRGDERGGPATRRAAASGAASGARQNIKRARAKDQGGRDAGAFAFMHVFSMFKGTKLDLIVANRQKYKLTYDFSSKRKM